MQEQTLKKKFKAYKKLRTPSKHLYRKLTFDLLHDINIKTYFLLMLTSCIISNYLQLPDIILPSCILMYLIFRIIKNYHQYHTNSKLKQKINNKQYIGIGTSIGQFSDINHPTNIKKNQNVSLSFDNCYQNILILGGIGTGKTTSVIQPILLQLLEQKTGGLILDIKADFMQFVTKASVLTNNDITIIGPEETSFNVIQGLTPEISASFLKSSLLLNQSKSDQFWVDSAYELARNCLGILSITPYYNLASLYNFLFDQLFFEKTLGNFFQEIQKLTTTQKSIFSNYLHYYQEIFAKFDPKVQSNIKATIAPLLAPFNHPTLCNAFCSNTNNLDLKILFSNKTVLVKLPLAQWGLAGKVIYNFIKLRFFNLMQNRTRCPNLNQTNPVFFLCDEYQEIASGNKDGLSDLNFWDKSRSSKTIGIISAQSISSFYAAIGNHDITKTILQNFRQKICLKTEDPATINYLNNIAGHNTTDISHYSKTTPIISPQLIRQLQPGQAISMLNIDGHSVDDVIKTQPFYL